jgi:transposase-like protein
MNLLQFQNKFTDEQACIDFLSTKRWGENNAICPHCKSNNFCKHSSRAIYTCLDCKKQFTARIGTIFEDSRLPLFKWFLAIYLATSIKKGISSIQLSKFISTTQKTAWFVLQRIREVMKDDFNQFDGITEIDEAYLGGREENKHKNKKGLKDKMVIVGMVNRNTQQVKTFKIASAEKENLLPKVNIYNKNGSTIITDTLHAYKDLKNNYNHETIKHSVGEYVRKENNKAYKIHTNSIEGFWSQLKRGIYGVYHWASVKHIQKYCNEFSFRYNNRKITDFERFTEWFSTCEDKRVFYKLLIK